MSENWKKYLEEGPLRDDPATRETMNGLILSGLGNPDKNVREQTAKLTDYMSQAADKHISREEFKTYVRDLIYSFDIDGPNMPADSRSSAAKLKEGIARLVD